MNFCTEKALECLEYTEDLRRSYNGKYGEENPKR